LLFLSFSSFSSFLLLSWPALIPFFSRPWRILSCFYTFFFNIFQKLFSAFLKTPMQIATFKNNFLALLKIAKFQFSKFSPLLFFAQKTHFSTTNLTKSCLPSVPVPHLRLQKLRFRADPQKYKIQF
jgi:hypothetical protein